MYMLVPMDNVPVGALSSALGAWYTVAFHQKGGTRRHSPCRTRTWIREPNARLEVKAVGRVPFRTSYASTDRFAQPSRKRLAARGGQMFHVLSPET